MFIATIGSPEDCRFFLNALLRCKAEDSAGGDEGNDLTNRPLATLSAEPDDVFDKDAEG